MAVILAALLGLLVGLVAGPLVLLWILGNAVTRP
jgi:hypothetical protein